jgi:hypothetical protein
MGLAKYRIKDGMAVGRPGEVFLCPKCGKICSGKNTHVINQGSQIARWCSRCTYYDVLKIDSGERLDHVNMGVMSRECHGYP